MRAFNGAIDDVRIYDRILSAEEIHYLYQSFDKNIKYDTDVRVPKYFNGDDWVAMGESKYVPNAVNFDGTNDYLYHGASSGSDPTLISGSFWVKRDPFNIGTSQTIVYYRNAPGEYFRIRFNTLNEVFIDGQETGIGVFKSIITTNNSITDGSWHHIAFSLDSTNRALDKIYIDDIDDTDSTGNTFSAFGGGDSLVVGGFNVSGTDKLYGDIADLWIDFDRYIDLSIEANRRKFIDENGDPVYLGSNGGIPTGSAPDIFLSGDTATWHTNKGTGGGFTENGALTDAITKPGGPFLPTDGLVGYWKMDEVSGSSVIDYASANNGTYRDSDGAVANVIPQSGVHGGAFDFTGHEVDLGSPSDLDMSGTNAFTIAAWLKPRTSGTVFSRGAVNSSANNTVYLFRRYNADLSRWNLGVSNGTNVCDAFTPVGTVEPDIWQFMVGTWDGTNLTIYKDGLNIGGQNCGAFSGLWDGGGTGVNRKTSIGADARNNRYYWYGTMDDVAVYDRALTVPEITDMYNSGICANPERLNGTIVYNADQNVMQYCDGVGSGDGWQATGP